MKVKLKDLAEFYNKAYKTISIWRETNPEIYNAMVAYYKMSKTKDIDLSLLSDEELLELMNKITDEMGNRI